MIYCDCDAPQYTEAVNVCRRCLRPVVEAGAWAEAHAPRRSHVQQCRELYFYDLTVSDELYGRMIEDAAERDDAEALRAELDPDCYPVQS